MRRIDSKSSRRDSRSEGVQEVRQMPRATTSAIAWAPPWPWSVAMLVRAGEAGVCLEE